MIQSLLSLDLLDHFSSHFYLFSLSNYTQCPALNWMQAIEKRESNGPFFWEAYIPVGETGVNSLQCRQYRERGMHGVVRDFTQDRHPSAMMGGV